MTDPDPAAAAVIEPDVRAAINAREDIILGHPPRIPPLDRNEAAELAHASTARLRDARGDAQALSLDQIPEIVFTMLRFPDLWESLCRLSIHLLGPKSVLPKRDRQLAILRTGWLCQAPFEWGEHVALSKTLGLTDSDIARAAIGSSAEGWNDHDRAIMRAAEELRADSLVSDETYAQLAKQLDDHQLTELLVLIGQFTTVAYFQNTLRLRLEPYNPGLAAR